MQQKVKSIMQKFTSIDAHTIGLLAIGLVALSVTYSSARIIQKNYQLEQQITQLQQENSLQEQTNKNQKLANEYYKTDAYLELAARKFFNKAAAGETLVLVPKEVAMKYTTPLPSTSEATKTNSATTYIQNWQLWLDFLSGKPMHSDN